jgi:hypothetical protein
LLPNCYQNMQVGLGAESWGISPFHCYAVHATQGDRWPPLRASLGASPPGSTRPRSGRASASFSNSAYSSSMTSAPADRARLWVSVQALLQGGPSSSPRSPTRLRCAADELSSRKQFSVLRKPPASVVHRDRGRGSRCVPHRWRRLR